MKEYLNTIYGLIDNQLMNADSTVRIKLENFSEPQIYWDICNRYKNKLSGQKFVAKLAKNKFDQFYIDANGDTKIHLDKLYSDGFVDVDNHMTYWRNESAAQNSVVFLMGTETVEDKGGLADFYTIRPSIINNKMNNKWAIWFKNLVSDFGDTEELAINNLFKIIFKYAPIDLLKLSNIIDELSPSQYLTEDIIEIICERLWEDWHIPNIKGDKYIPSVAQLAKRGFPLIEKSLKFRDRQDWKNSITESKIKKIEEQIAKWEKEVTLDDNCESFSKQFNKYAEFKEGLLNYIKGFNQSQLKEKLCACNFGVINEILNIKLGKGSSSKTKTKVIGDPFLAIIQSILIAINRSDIKYGLERVTIDIQSIKLAEVYTDEQLAEQWRNICLFGGGIIEFLHQEEWINGEGDTIEFLYKQDDYFSPLKINDLLNGILQKGSKSQKNSKVELEITLNGKGEQDSHKFLWEFNPYEYWINSFSHLDEHLIDYFNNEDRLMPFGTISNFGELVNATNEEEFFININKGSIKLTNNILKVLERKLNGTNNEKLLVKVRGVAYKFQEFVEEITEEGFFNTFNGCKENTCIGFVQEYVRLIHFILKSDFTTQVRERLYLLSNSFLIGESTKYGFEQKGLKGAIVPPYHPAMLEKVQAQFLFLREGAKELYQKILSDELSAVEKHFERLAQLSTITSGVDLLISDESKMYLKTKNVYGYYALYGSSSSSLNLISANNLLNDEIIDEEEFSKKELVAETPISKVITKNIIDYLCTFPSNLDGLSLLFINPVELQSVIAGIHSVVEKLKKQENEVRIKLQILMSSKKQTGRNYLSYWLDNFFLEEDNVDIQTFFNVYDENTSKFTEHLRGLIDYTDIVFIQNILNVKEINFERTQKKALPISDSRYPMVFIPLPVFKTSVDRKTSLSQFQFAASFIHSQLICKVENPFGVDDNYRVIQKLELGGNSKEILDFIHEKARWVVCLDTGIDRELVKLNNNRIISFSTGEGPFGELNVTISAKENIQEDLINRLKKRIKMQFPTWDKETVRIAAENCLKISSKLDGSQVLKALNPNDYEIHSFLAYILTAEVLKVYIENDKYLVRSLIHLDSYTHWFDTRSKRPDFLLLEILLDDIKDKGIMINATLIECKMGNSNEEYILKAKEQLEIGFMELSKRWNPISQSVERKFWFTQLYRSLVFSVINREDYSDEYYKFTNALQQIIDGKFEIAWNTNLFTYWLDADNNEEVSGKLLDEQISYTHKAFGQISVQKMLLPTEFRDQKEFKYEDPTFPDTNQDDFEEEEKDYVEHGGNVDNDGCISIEPKDEQIKIDKNSIEEKSTNTSEKEDNLENTHNEVLHNTTITRTNQERKLEDIRVLIGEDIRTREKVYWEFGHPGLPNRHILISGNSGTGKTYCMQTLLMELSKQGISSMVFDYTDGFTTNKLEPEFKQEIGEKIVQAPVYYQPFPINPFKKYQIEIDGQTFPQKDVDVAERITSVFRKVYNFGDQQASSIYRATRNGLQKFKENMTLELLRKELHNISSEIPNAKTVISKIDPLVDREPFDCTNSKDWSELHVNPGTVFVVQLTGFTRDVQLVITEFILWDAWYYNVKAGDKNKPFPVILDEAQNLDHGEKSPSGMILTEGRKFGWSGWFATQFMKDQLKKDEIQRLQQASTKLYFSPPETELSDIVSYLEPDKARSKVWHKRLAQLKKGECVVSGYSFKNDSLLKQPPRIVKVMSFKERLDNE